MLINIELAKSTLWMLINELASSQRLWKTAVKILFSRARWLVCVNIVACLPKANVCVWLWKIKIHCHIQCWWWWWWEHWRDMQNGQHWRQALWRSVWATLWVHCMFQMVALRLLSYLISPPAHLYYLSPSIQFWRTILLALDIALYKGGSSSKMGAETIQSYACFGNFLSFQLH